MNALNLARKAYATAETPIRTPRSIEYEAFARITRRLNAATGRGKQNFSELAEAIHANRRLWTMLATDVADTGNGLPQDLRARIFYLAEFTNHHSHLVLNGEADPAPLVEINTAMMRGLRNQVVPS